MYHHRPHTIKSSISIIMELHRYCMKPFQEVFSAHRPLLHLNWPRVAVQVNCRYSPLYTVVAFLTFFSVAKYKTRPFLDLFENATDYTFVIRDFLGSVQADGKVSNVSEDLNTELHDVRGSAFLQISKQIINCTEPTPTPNAIMRCLSRALRTKPESSSHTFEVYQNRMLVGLVTLAYNGSSETSLKIFLGDGKAEMIVRSLTMGEFAVRRSAYM